MQPRMGEKGRKQLPMLSGNDRLMLHGIADNLRHVHRNLPPSPPSTSSTDIAGQAAIADGVAGDRGRGSDRLNYNQKAMQEIRQSLKNFHKLDGQSANSGINGCSPSPNENMVRQIMIMGTDKVGCVRIFRQHADSFNIQNALDNLGRDSSVFLSSLLCFLNVEVIWLLD